MAKNKNIIRHKMRESLSDRILVGVIYVVMTFLAVITLYPMLYVLFASFSDPIQFAIKKGLLFKPAGFSIIGYKSVMTMRTFWRGYGMTMFYLVAGTLINMTLTILGAYTMSRKFMLRKPIMLLMIFTMYFGGGMIPTYLTIKNMGMTGTIWSILLPGCISVYNLIILRTGFEGIPESLVESAEMDGAGDLTILWKIILPLSKASLATITLFYAVGRWGEWYNAMVYLESNRSLYPLQMILRETLVEGQNLDVAVDVMGVSTADSILVKEISKYSMVIISTVPVLIVYPFVQKYFVKGVMIGSVKG